MYFLFFFVLHRPCQQGDKALGGSEDVRLDRKLCIASSPVGRQPAGILRETQSLVTTAGLSRRSLKRLRLIKCRGEEGCCPICRRPPQPRPRRMPWGRRLLPLRRIKSCHEFAVAKPGQPVRPSLCATFGARMPPRLVGYCLLWLSIHVHIYIYIYIYIYFFF